MQKLKAKTKHNTLLFDSIKDFCLYFGQSIQAFRDWRSKNKGKKKRKMKIDVEIEFEEGE